LGIRRRTPVSDCRLHGPVLADRLEEIEPFIEVPLLPLHLSRSVVARLGACGTTLDPCIANTRADESRPPDDIKGLYIARGTSHAKYSRGGEIEDTHAWLGHPGGALSLLTRPI
jgi:hypothetical protein